MKDDFKKEADEEIGKISYVGRKVMWKTVFAVIPLIALLGIVGFGVRYCSVNADRVIFKNSITYTEEMAQFIAKSYNEYNSAETDVEKKAIMEYVVMRYPNIDVSKIENSQLKNFYSQCVIGGN